MARPTRPLMVVYVVWHPAFEDGRAIAKRLYEHYRRELFENVSGGAGLSVVYRSLIDPETNTLLNIDIDDAETTAVILLFDEKFAADQAYVAWARELTEQTDRAGLRARVFPVAIDGAFVRTGFAQQAARWDQWQDMDEGARFVRLTSDLTYQFARMLRSYLERLRGLEEEEAALDKYLSKVQVFLSHSKHDPDGERIAKLVRMALFEGEGLSSFFDVRDIPTGIRFDSAILHQVRVSAVVAIYTDSYSSREWCRREIIEAKRWQVPLVVANCIADSDERGFPYMGNVPIVRMDPSAADRIDRIVARLLDEAFKDFLWRCRIELAKALKNENVVFLPRPPELISLATLEGRNSWDVTIVYPDPPVGAEEQRLFEVIAPKVLLRSLTEWLAEAEVEI